MCPRPAHWPPDPPTDGGLLRCPHPDSRIRIDVTVDLGFVYCTECDRRLWWTRTRGRLTAEGLRFELRERERRAAAT
jgi:hypothetical protein